MTIQVTQAHIDAGSRRSPYGCPVALALREALEPRLPGCRVAVCVSCFWVETGAGHRMATLAPPPEVMAFLKAYDRRPSSVVAPFTFTFEPERLEW